MAIINKCSKCGSKVQEEWYFCPMCSATLQYHDNGKIISKPQHLVNFLVENMLPPKNKEECTFSHAEISSAWINNNDDRVVVISWESPGIGWGEVTLIQSLEEDSPIFIEDESMGRDFVKALLDIWLIMQSWGVTLEKPILPRHV